MAGPGISFVEGLTGGQSPQPGGAAPVSPIQTAIKLLSLRLPRVAGANALAPQGLLQSPGSQGLGMPDGQGPMGLEQILMHLFGRGPMMPGGQAGPPMPKFTPGEGGGTPPPQVGPPQGPRLPTFQPPVVDRTNPPAGNRPPGDVLQTGAWKGYGPDFSNLALENRNY